MYNYPKMVQIKKEPEHWYKLSEGRLRLGFGAFGVAVIASHILLKPPQLWRAAAMGSFSMNCVYPLWSFQHSNFQLLETAVAMLLVGLTVVAMTNSNVPLLCIAIALHGVWDALKHGLELGVQMFAWYSMSCLAFDFLWAGYLYYDWTLRGYK